MKTPNRALPQVFAVVFLLLVALPVFAQSAAYYEENACPFADLAGESVTCGTLYVPENRLRADSGLIELAFAILPANGSTPSPHPVVYLEGGPGGSALLGIDVWLTSALREDYDIILFDQRGTGYSTPSLACDLEEANANLDDPAAACYERLSGQGIDLGAYNSAQSAADIDDLLRVLNIPSAHIFGVSYGTRLALTMMRDYPQRIRSVILDAVYPPHVNAYESAVLWQHEAYERLFADCAADSACRSAYPNLRNTFYGAVDQLNRNPQTFSDGFEDVEFDGSYLMSFLFEALYETDSLPYLPRLIADIAEGNPDALVDFYDDAASESEDDTDADLAGGDDVYPEDQFLMDMFGYDSVDDLYAEEALDDLTDEEYFALIEEAVYLYTDSMSDDELDDWLLDFFSFNSYDELYTYLDLLSDEEYVDVLYELILLGYEGGAFDLMDDAGGIAYEVSDFSSGMFNSVTCTEEVPFNRLSLIEQLAVNVPRVVVDMGIDDAQTQQDECLLWNVPSAPAIENQPVTSTLPTLIFSGNYDPVTPPAWGQAAADFLPNSTHLVFPGIGHGALDVHPCPTGIALAFLANPAAPLDTSCVAAMRAPQFVVRP